MHVADLHRRSVEGFVTRLEALATAGEDAWSRPTPCPEWDVRALVNHIVYEDLWTVSLMEGATLDEIGERYEGDLLGDDPIVLAQAACEAAMTAAASGIVAGRTVHLSSGDSPATEYAHQLAADHVIHGWDLAAAIDADRTIDPEVVAACAAWFADREAMYREGGVIGPRPAEAGNPDDPQDQLLTAFGRNPSWTPPAG